MERSESLPSQEVMLHASQNAITVTDAVVAATHALGPTYIATFLTALIYHLSIEADHTLVAQAFRDAAERVLEHPPLNRAPPPAGVKPS